MESAQGKGWPNAVADKALQAGPVGGLDAEGKPFSAPLSWTDAGTEDVSLTVSRGRACGHVTQLLRLAELVEEVGP